MSITRFAEGFSEGVTAGTALGRGIREGRSARSMGKATMILSEMQGMVPGVGQAAGVPDGDGNGAAPTGYAGNEWESAKQRYIAAMKGVSDPQVLERMMDQMVELEKGKVMDYGRMALASIQSGDMDSAQRYLAGVSYFTDPGNTPTVRVAEDGTALMASPDGKPMVLTPDNLADFLHQMENFEGWRDFTFEKEKHGDMMEYRDKQLASEAADRALRTANDTRSTDSGIARDEATIARYAVQNEQTRRDMELADKNFKAGMDKARADAADKVREDANKYLKEYLEDTGSIDATGDDGGDEDPMMPDMGGGIPLDSKSQGIVDQNRAATTVLDSSTTAQEAQARETKANLRNFLMGNEGGNMLDFQTILAAISSGDPSMSGQRAAALTIRAIMSDGRPDPTTGQVSNNAYVDPENGVLVIETGGRKDYHRIAPAFMQSMVNILPPLAPAPAPAPAAPAPTEGGIPPDQTGS